MGYGYGPNGLLTLEALEREHEERGKTIRTLRAKLEKYETDATYAAGECRVELPEPGTDAARLLTANRLLRAKLAEVGNLADAGLDRFRDLGAVVNLLRAIKATTTAEERDPDREI